MTPTQPCAQCGTPFTPSQTNHICCSRKCSKQRGRDIARAKYLAEYVPTIRNCERCGKQLEALTRNGGNRKYCAEPCKTPTCEPVADGVPCQHCGQLFERNGRQKYCGSRCRVEHFKAMHDEGEEIPVVDIDEAPRRLAVAKLFDRFEGGGAFDHFDAPTWINPADRRYWR